MLIDDSDEVKDPGKELWMSYESWQKEKEWKEKRENELLEWSRKPYKEKYPEPRSLIENTKGFWHRLVRSFQKL